MTWLFQTMRHARLSSAVSLKHGCAHRRNRLLPFDIPEVLERILYFLDFESRRRTRLVAKQWCAASRRFLAIGTVWHEILAPWQQDLVLELLPSLDRFSFLSTEGDIYELPRVQVAWKRLRSHVQAGAASRLQNLTIVGYVNVGRWVLPLLPSLLALKIIQLQFVNPETYTVAMFLDACPLLEELAVNPILRPNSGTEPTLEAGALHTPCSLLSLTVHQVSMTQDSLEAVILICPRLTSISLIAIMDPSPTEDAEVNNHFEDATATQYSRLDAGRLLAVIARSCPRLQHLHCSAIRGYNDMVASLSQFANLSLLGLPSQTICPQLISTIQQYPNALTSLMLDGTFENSAETSLCLHSYLCSAPQLQQLLAFRIDFDVGLLILRAGAASDKVWACRNLLSLTISFDRSQGDQTYSVVDHSRMIYGYISQVCPRLEHLTLSCDLIDCSLDGGLCLLANLDNLRSLEIRTTAHGNLHLWDFGWMDNEPTILQKITQKMSFNEIRLQKTLRTQYEWLGCQDSRMVDKERLRKLGFSARDTAAIAARGSRAEAKGQPIRWPLLKRFAISLSLDRRGRERTIEGYIKKVRPDVIWGTE